MWVVHQRSTGLREAVAAAAAAAAAVVVVVVTATAEDLTVDSLTEPLVFNEDKRLVRILLPLCPLRIVGIAGKFVDREGSTAFRLDVLWYSTTLNPSTLCNSASYRNSISRHQTKAPIVLPL